MRAGRARAVPGVGGTGRAEIAASLPWLAAEMPRHYLGLVGAIGYRTAARAAIEQGEEVAIVMRPDRITASDFTAETPLVGRVWLLVKRVLPPWL